MTTLPSTVRLDDLIGAVTAAHEAPLDQVAAAVLLGQHLDEVSDTLVGHFVDRARGAGASWAEIGRSLGVSKQAAQKRFVPRSDAAPDPSEGFSRFTDEARAVIVRAQEEARSAGNDTIGINHLVLALVADPDAPSAQAVVAQGIALEDVRRTATATLPAASGVVPAMVPFDVHTRRALEATFGTAARLGADAIGTGHLLLAVLEVEDGTGVLAGRGVDRAAAEDHVARSARQG